MKKINKNIFTIVASIATVVATAVATSACLLYLYQPEEPKSLRDE